MDFLSVFFFVLYGFFSGLFTAKYIGARTFLGVGLCCITGLFVCPIILGYTLGEFLRDNSSDDVFKL